MSDNQDIVDNPEEQLPNVEHEKQLDITIESTNTIEGDNNFTIPTFSLPTKRTNELHKRLLKSENEFSNSNTNDNTMDSKAKTEIATKSQSFMSSKKQKMKMIPTLNIVDYYKEPMWGGVSTKPYSLEVIKNGGIIDTIDITRKSFYVFGRINECDIYLEHPSLSRFHAIVQNCPVDTQHYQEGWYLYDMDSTHGTYLNKNRLKPRVYYRIKVGHMIKFAGSSRLYIVQV